MTPPVVIYSFEPFELQVCGKIRTLKRSGKPIGRRATMTLVLLHALASVKANSPPNVTPWTSWEDLRRQTWLADDGAPLAATKKGNFDVTMQRLKTLLGEGVVEPDGKGNWALMLPVVVIPTGGLEGAPTDRAADPTPVPPRPVFWGQATAKIPTGIWSSRASSGNTVTIPSTFRGHGAGRQQVQNILHVTVGADVGRYAVLASTDLVIIGRDPAAGLYLPDGSVSRRHCTVQLRVDTRVWVRDLGSDNGTYVNGALIEAGELRQGDHLQVGDVVLRLEQFTLAEISAIDQTFERLQATRRGAGVGAPGRLPEHDASALILRLDEDAGARVAFVVVVESVDEVERQHGTDVAERLVATVQRIALDAIRGHDVIFRTVGAEIMAFAFSLEIAEADFAAEKMRAGFVGYRWSHLAKGLSASVSVVVSARRPDEAWQDWVDRSRAASDDAGPTSERLSAEPTESTPPDRLPETLAAVDNVVMDDLVTAAPPEASSAPVTPVQRPAGRSA